jgi:hypothetical protein
VGNRLQATASCNESGERKSNSKGERGIEPSLGKIFNIVYNIHWGEPMVDIFQTVKYEGGNTTLKEK